MQEMKHFSDCHNQIYGEFLKTKIFEKLAISNHFGYVGSFLTDLSDMQDFCVGDENISESEIQYMSCDLGHHASVKIHD